LCSIETGWGFGGHLHCRPCRTTVIEFIWFSNNSNKWSIVIGTSTDRILTCRSEGIARRCHRTTRISSKSSAWVNGNDWNSAPSIG
jgi:hypothetical protein